MPLLLLHVLQLLALLDLGRDIHQHLQRADGPNGTSSVNLKKQKSQKRLTAFIGASIDDIRLERKRERTVPLDRKRLKNHLCHKR